MADPPVPSSDRPQAGPDMAPSQAVQPSQRSAHAHWATQALVELSLETSLQHLPEKQVLACTEATPLRQALQQMHERRVGSMLVVDGAGAPRGILTQRDVLARITLPQQPLDAPISQVMSTPVYSVAAEQTLQDAALLMARRGVRHVPVTSRGRVVNMVSERDLFAQQRLSLKDVGSGIRAADDLAALKAQAAAIRGLARNLLGQGVQARQLTELISHLNDLLTTRLVEMTATRHGADLAQACWLSFGSEGRSEQTLATDQDNGLVFLSEQPTRDRPKWLALAAEVNEGLDTCGYPLCKGGVMASNPECCLTPAEWRHRFLQWIDHGAPQDLLNASIYFDLRALCGNVDLALPLVQLLQEAPCKVPRFIKQMADNTLRHGPPLNWRGALDTHESHGEALLDLKLHGTALFVDAARLYALAQGLAAVGTRPRLQAVAVRLHVQPHEAEAWLAGFDFLQMLRLQVQFGAHGPLRANPNEIDTLRLHDIDRRMLREVMHLARSLQKRVELDYQR